ncbi:MAG: cystathionine gamma-lyase [Thaumarchaeota archaeon]|nr:cystathionine gamma-lyase [Nitrososphaerota archaeon]
MRDGTRAVRAGLPPTAQGEPFLPGPTFAGTYAFSGEVGTSAYTYGRYHNPTWTNYERALTELEGGPTIAFSSGMAAITAVLAVTLNPGRTGNVVVMPSDGYYGARKLAEGYFAERGIQVRKAQTAGGAQGAMLDGATLLWLETPTNPGLEVCDIAELVRQAHGKGVLVAVDNTTATPLGQRPIELGADLSISSDTKGLTGHSDLTLGHVSAREQEWADKLLAFRTQQGAVPGPMEVWLAHRSLATLELRLERQCGTALEVAKSISARPEVSSVRYPGLRADPSHEVASKQMMHYGPIVSFTLEGQQQAEEFLKACKIIVTATSFGGIHSMAERRARWGGDAISPGFIRFSAGCEDTEDVVEDVLQALDTISK